MAFIMIVEDELPEAKRKLDDSYVYKCLFNSDSKEAYHEKLGIKKLNDNLLFVGENKAIRSLRMKNQEDGEYAKAMQSIVTRVFDSNSHIGIVNDAYSNKNMVLILSGVFVDSLDKDGNGGTITPNNLLQMRDMVIRELGVREGMKVYTLELFTSGIEVDDDYNYNRFIETQKHLMRDESQNIDEGIVIKFVRLFKFKTISYYSKLKDFTLDEIMEALDYYGFLNNDIFKGEFYVYEEEARIILAKRLSALSFKNDIEILIKEGILKPDIITYDIGLDI